MFEQSQAEKISLAVERAKKRLAQRIDYIKWEYKHLKPFIADYHKRARLPEPPSEELISIELEMAAADAGPTVIDHGK